MAYKKVGVQKWGCRTEIQVIVFARLQIMFLLSINVNFAGHISDREKLHVVWLKNSAPSRCLVIVVAQEPTQALSTSDLAAVALKVCLRGNELVGEALVIPLGMIM